jgi:acetyl esterase/lipase/Tol biopolymer transport system component
MKNILAGLLLLLLYPHLYAQKKPLDHTVYDGWQSISERLIAPNGKWVVYTVNPQEGDGELFVRSAAGGDPVRVARGYGAQITQDSRFVVFRIRPAYAQTREARIRKKRPDEMPKDSLGFLELGKTTVVKVARTKSFKLPAKGSGWLAYHREKEATTPRAAALPTQKTVDSLKKTIDSLTLLVREIKNVKGGNRDGMDADEDGVSGSSAGEGSDLVLRNLLTGRELLFRNVSDYYFNEGGQKLLLRLTKAPRDSGSANAVVLHDLKSGTTDTLLKGGNDFRGFALTEDGRRVAFLAERDSSRSLTKYYSLYHYQQGDDSAQLLVDKHTVGMELGMTVSENGAVSFSKSGRRLLFGTAPLPVPKDTSLVEMDLVKVDIWNYKDDYLQTQQLFQLNNELKRSYLAVFDFTTNRLQQLGSKELQTVIPVNEGDGKYFVAFTDTGRRVETQWAGAQKRDIYAIDVHTGALTLVKKNHRGQVFSSPEGKYLVLYDPQLKNFFAWEGKALRNTTAKIPFPLYEEDNDVPNDPGPYGLMGWHEGDSAFYVYDRYDIWKVDPKGAAAPENLTKGRRIRAIHRYLRTNPEERYISSGQDLHLRITGEETRQSGIALLRNGMPVYLTKKPEAAYNTFLKAKDAPVYLYSRESYTESPDLYLLAAGSSVSTAPDAIPLTSINPQQANYNWGTAELYRWKALDGKPAKGLIYKPENFDSTKRYPVIFYFYERHTNELYNYTAPAPTPSRLNIPFFVSRGYIVVSPDIIYTKGHPGKDAYNYVVSAAQSLSKKRWIDSKNMGLQGQSWGGYQVAYLITATDLFKAAWAGAPVVNMFSAYGGIRWESGNNRQFQYEKGQSRIAATPWERPDLYIENSPFFHLQKVKTPLVIMANDADGAVPWYQGIEFFTAMRRLGKPVWMLNYNGEAHNLVERKNRKDIQIREQQFFDWLLKGEKPARWLEEGVPAVRKGKDWGLQVVDGNN